MSQTLDARAVRVESSPRVLMKRYSILARIKCNRIGAMQTHNKRDESDVCGLHSYKT